jgi:hypothetical protein
MAREVLSMRPFPSFRSWIIVPALAASAWGAAQQEPRPQVMAPQQTAPSPPNAAQTPTDLTPPQQPAQDSQAQPPAPRFSKEQLEQIVAPIALYPDALLSQTFMAASYPLEVVEASRFMQQNPKLTGKQLEDALKDKEWDASVKALCGYPDVLSRLDQNLDWMRDLGDAFLAQQSEVMDTVQRMRQNAYDAGTLKSTKEQDVTVRDDRIIVVEPTNPEVVYVPVYYPTYVYRGWGYPWWYYPAFYVPPPPHFVPFAFHLGLWFGPPPLFGRCYWGWGHSHCDVDVHVHNTFVERVDRRPVVINTPAAVAPWQHDPVHRRGISYRNPALDRRFAPNAAVPSRRFDRDDLRGRTRSPAMPPRAGDRRDLPRSPPRTTPPPHTTPQPRPQGGGATDRPDRPDRTDRPGGAPPDRAGGGPPDRAPTSPSSPNASVPSGSPDVTAPSRGDRDDRFDRTGDADLDRDALRRGRDSLRDRVVRPPAPTSPPRVVRPPRTDSPRPPRPNQRPSNPRARGE